MPVDKYISTLLEQISNEKAKMDIEKEIRQHIEEQIESYRLDGMEEKDAVEASVRDMGDPVEAGVELNRIHRPKMPWKMSALIILTGLVGFFIKILFFYSPFWQSGRWIIGREAVMMLFGIIIMSGVCMVDYSIIGKYSRQLMVVILMVNLLGSMFYAKTIGGNIYLILPYNVMITPIYLLMITVPLFGGILYCYRWGNWKAVLKCIAWMLLPCAAAVLIYSEVSTAFLLLLVELFTLISVLLKGWFHVNAKKWIISLLSCFAGICALFIAGIYCLGGFQRMMLQSWFQPENYEHGYILDVVRKIVQGSRFAGKGTMSEALFVLPSVEHNYMLNFVMSEYGIAAMIIILALFALLCVMLYRGVWKQKNQLGRLMGTACCVMISVQFILYVLADTGLLHKSYMDCPFLSAGSFSCVFLNYFLLGILLSIYRYQNVLPAHGPNAYETEI